MYVGSQSFNDLVSTLKIPRPYSEHTRSLFPSLFFIYLTDSLSISPSNLFFPNPFPIPPTICLCVFVILAVKHPDRVKIHK